MEGTFFHLSGISLKLWVHVQDLEFPFGVGRRVVLWIWYGEPVIEIPQKYINMRI